MERKKICIVVAEPVTAVSFFKDHIKKLSEQFDVYLVSTIRDSGVIDRLNLTGFKSIEIKRRPSIWSDLNGLNRLFWYFKKERFFCVLSMSSKPSLLTALAGFAARVPHRIRIFTGQLWCNMRGWKRSFFMLVDKLTVSLDTELLVDGVSQMEFLESSGIIKKGQAQVMANGSICGVDIDRFRYSPETRIVERQQLGLLEEVVYFFMGRMKTEKGINELLAAMDKMVIECPMAVLLLVGRDEEHCQERISFYKNLKEGKNILFYGYTDTPNLLLQAADVFVMPSYREGFGMSVLEASCVNLPVICSDAYGMRDSMVDDVTGIRCKVGDVDSLYNAMKKLYFDSDLRRELGEAGHKYVVGSFTKDMVTNALYDFILRLK